MLNSFLASTKIRNSFSTRSKILNSVLPSIEILNSVLPKGSSTRLCHAWRSQTRPCQASRSSTQSFPGILDSVFATHEYRKLDLAKHRDLQFDIARHLRLAQHVAFKPEVWITVACVCVVRALKIPERCFTNYDNDLNRSMRRRQRYKAVQKWVPFNQCQLGWKSNWVHQQQSRSGHKIASIPWPRPILIRSKERQNPFGHKRFMICSQNNCGLINGVACDGKVASVMRGRIDVSREGRGESPIGWTEKYRWEGSVTFRALGYMKVSFQVILTLLYVDGHFSEDREEWQKKLQRHCEEVYTDQEETKAVQEKNNRIF